MRMRIRIPLFPAFLAALLLLQGTAAAETVVSIMPRSQESFVVTGDFAVSVCGLDLTINYDTETLKDPRVFKGSSLFSTKNTFSATTDVPGSVSVSFNSDQGIKGKGNLLQLNFNRAGKDPGAITSMQASLRDLNGYAVPCRISITNPEPAAPEEAPPARPVEGPASRPADKPGNPRNPSSGAPLRETVPVGGESLTTQGQMGWSHLSYRRHLGALARFQALSELVTEEDLRGVFSEDPSSAVRQDPPVLLSDGVAKAVISISDLGMEPAKQFILRGVHAVSVRKGETGGEWQIEVVAESGGAEASLFLLTETEVHEYPLTVVPPLSGNGGGAPDNASIRESFCRFRSNSASPGAKNDCADGEALAHDFAIWANYFARSFSTPSIGSER